MLADQASLAATAAAAAALSAGLSQGAALATQATFGKFTTAYNSYSDLINLRNEALQEQIYNISIPVPDDEARDRMMDKALSKPIKGSTAKKPIWGDTSA